MLSAEIFLGLSGSGWTTLVIKWRIRRKKGYSCQETPSDNGCIVESAWRIISMVHRLTYDSACRLQESMKEQIRMRISTSISCK